MPPGEAGTYLVHFTGSADHNIRLRGIARDRGWSLSEKGFHRIDEEGQPLAGDAAELRTFADEAAVYAFLDLAYIEPELREDRGEVEAAREGRLPALITRADLRGDLHTHSDWSDGVHPIEVMAEACRGLGYAYQVLTDHSQSLAIAHGLDPDRVEQERAIIAELNARFAAEAAAGIAPAGANPGGFRLLHGCELEVRADGQLDYEDDLLARFDVVVASVHVARRQSRAELTRRTLNAIRSPHVDVIAHPSGRMIQTRDDLDLDWDAVFEAAAANGTALEINGSPHRLDLAAGARAARDVDGLPADDRLGRPPDRGARVRPLGRPTRRGGRGWSPRTCSTRGRSTSCWPGSPASRTGCEPPAGHGRIPSAPMTTPDAVSDPTAALARRELVVAAVVMVALTRAVEPADAFLVAGLLPVVMLVAGVGVLNLGDRRQPAVSRRSSSRRC